jgi:hypothetical protein
MRHIGYRGSASSTTLSEGIIEADALLQTPLTYRAET